jgi:recombination protein RecR
VKGNNDIDALMGLVAKLPGLGPRSARRVVLHLLRKRETLMDPLIQSLERVKQNVRLCAICGNLDTVDPCGICTDQRRDESTLCVVEDVADLWAVERSGFFRGRYHVLGGTLSAIEGRGPEQLRIPLLIRRAAAEEVKEIILATNATVEGQTTAHYLTEALAECGVKITRLAQGIPIGGELDYLDEGTLGAALKSRQSF